MIKLLVFPRDANPYQHLLYEELSDRVEVSYIDASSDGSLVSWLALMPALLTKLALCRLRGFRAIHVHWVYPFYVPRRRPFHRQLTYLQILGFLAMVWVLRFRVVWTVHNVVPQIPQTPDDEQLMRMLSRLARAKIVHSEHVVQSMADHGLDTDGVTVIPHGNYGGVYPDHVSRDEARGELGIEPGRFVVLFFGTVSLYKGIEDLLDAVRACHRSDPGFTLVVAGRCDDEALRRRIADAAAEGFVIFHPGHVDDERVAVYFNACDVVCLPFTAITTSGSVVLALSFGTPVIAPRMGALCDLPDDVGLFYDPAEPGALQRNLVAARADPERLAAVGAKAGDHVRSISWATVADRTYAVYQAVLPDGGAKRAGAPPAVGA